MAETKSVNPVQFFDDRPYAVMGEATKKDFTTKVTKVDPDVADPDVPGSSEQEQTDGDAEPIAPPEVVTLDPSDGDPVVDPGVPGSSEPENNDEADDSDDETEADDTISFD